MDKYGTLLMGIASGKSSKPKNTPNINNLADKIINSSNAPQGNEARRKWLGVSKATYDKVRKEINRRYSYEHTIHIISGNDRLRTTRNEILNRKDDYGDSLFAGFEAFVK